MRLVLFLVLGLCAAAATAQDRPRPQPRPEETRCTMDGLHCIRLASYVRDTCALIGTAALAAGIDEGFFARLLWQESLFDPSAVSPAGAQGIAQFMPGTAALRNLDDPFNPAKAILASADYLGELTRDFGSYGMAAVAYNAGEARAARFAGNPASGVPGETRAYVQRITGHSARAWRDDPPDDVDYSLAPDTPFEEACRRQAAKRSIRSFTPTRAWGVVMASARTQGSIEARADRLRRERAAALAPYEVRIGSQVVPGFGTRPRYVARIDAGSQSAARAICDELRDAQMFCRIVGP